MFSGSRILPSEETMDFFKAILIWEAVNLEKDLFLTETEIISKSLAFGEDLKMETWLFLHGFG